jgi:hypothetical protein
MLAIRQKLMSKHSVAATEMVLAELHAKLPEKSSDELLAYIDEWELTPHMDDGEMTGVKMIKGTEFHFVSGEDFKLNRKSLRASLAPHMERYGFLTTRVEHHDKANMRFNKLFGFKPTWSDDQFQYFILTELPFGDKSCQQSQ